VGARRKGNLCNAYRNAALNRTFNARTRRAQDISNLQITATSICQKTMKQKKYIQGDAQIQIVRGDESSGNRSNGARISDWVLWSLLRSGCRQQEARRYSAGRAYMCGISKSEMLLLGRSTPSYITERPLLRPKGSTKEGGGLGPPGSIYVH
jgi:hypothetical protein